MGNHHSQTPTTPTVFQVVKMSNAELASAYAALILADDGIEITADKLNTLIKAAGVADIEPIWATLFAKALEGKDVKDLLLNGLRWWCRCCSCCRWRCCR